MRRCVKTAAGSLTPDSVRIHRNHIHSSVKNKYHKQLGTHPGFGIQDSSHPECRIPNPEAQVLCVNSRLRGCADSYSMKSFLKGWKIGEPHLFLLISWDVSQFKPPIAHESVLILGLIHMIR